jgi:hypothetical protein
LGNKAEAALKEAARDLTAMGHAHTMELAAQQLHSRRKKYVDAVTMSYEEGVWVLSLDASVLWIEEGLEAGDMLDAMLKSPKAKTARDGSKYLIVPFQHNALPQNTPASQRPIVDAVKAEMKKRDIPWGKVERDEKGRPLIGRLHTFSIEHAPLGTGRGSGPAQGWGPAGDVRQGPNHRQIQGGGPGGGGVPFLRNVAVYQRALGPKAPPGMHETAEANHGVKRDVMTFRIASSKHKGQGRWQRPALPPVLIFDQVYDWMIQEFDRTIGPAVAAKVAGG